MSGLVGEVAAAQAAGTKPNVVINLADDLGNAYLVLSRQRYQNPEHRQARQ